jgi:hypothetical protein
VAVARKGVFVTTPNRWFPIEFHTLLPLVHWLPPEHFRKLLVLTGRDFFAGQRNLNLLSMRQLRRIAAHAGVGDCHIDAISLLGWPTNLLLWAHKPAVASARPPKQEHTARVASTPSHHCLAIIPADAWSQS